jgi:adenylylsulfate kinase-like enzyme
VGGVFVDVFVRASLPVCEQRDPTGLYARARRGDVVNVAGIDLPYEEPVAAAIVLDTVDATPAQNVARLIAHLHETGLMPLVARSGAKPDPIADP